MKNSGQLFIPGYSEVHEDENFMIILRISESAMGLCYKYHKLWFGLTMSIRVVVILYALLVHLVLFRTGAVRNFILLLTGSSYM